jgi:hypothetical protein
MSTQAVFDSKFNIVGVDPDTSQVIQIPGTEFQAPASSDLFLKIAVMPNYKAEYGSGIAFDSKEEITDEKIKMYVEGREERMALLREAHGFATKPKVIGVGIDFEIRAESAKETAHPESYRMRLTDIHVGKRFSEYQPEVLQPQFDKYFIAEGWRHQRKTYNNYHFPQFNKEDHRVSPACELLCYKDDWVTDGLNWSQTQNYVDFSVEICKGKTANFELLSSQTADAEDLSAFPIGSIYTLPIRVWWSELA